MKNLLRWQYVVPRVLAILVALLAVQYALGLWGRERVVQAVSQKVGAKGELAAARVSFVDGRVTLGDLRIADPRQPMRNLLAADYCDFAFDTGLYLRRGTLVGQGAIEGLRLLTPRESSGALAGAVPWSPLPAVTCGEAESQAVVAWMKEVDAKFAGDGAEPFESLQLTAHLAEQGTQEMAALEQRLRELEARSEALRAQAASADDNPLRGGEFLASLPNQLAAIRAESAALAADVEKLPNRFEVGRRAIVAARVRDDKQLRERLGMNASVVQPLAAYLLSEPATNFANELVGWLRWTRSVLPAQGQSANSVRQADDVNTLIAKRPSPALLLHTLALEGSANLGGQPVRFCGTLNDFTTEPWLLDHPMRLRLLSADSATIDVRSSIDRSGPIARDELLVDCKELPLPPQSLGRTDGLRLSLGESAASLNVSIQLTGDELSGEIQIVQKGVQMSPSTGSELGHVPLAATLQETLGDVHSLATRLTLRGTLAEPRASLWSSIGPATAKALDIALRRAADEQADRVMALAQRRIDERLAGIDRQIADKQADLAPRLAASASQVTWLATQYAAPQRLEAERLGRLPAGSLFR